MQRRMWSIGLGLVGLALAIGPVGAQASGPWINVYAVGDAYDVDVSCQDLAAGDPVGTLSAGECYEYEEFNEMGDTGFDAFKLCSAENEAGTGATEVFLGYRYDLEVHAADTGPIGDGLAGWNDLNETSTFLGGDELHITTANPGVWHTLAMSGPPELWTYTEIFSEPAGSSTAVVKVCVGIIAGAPSAVDYGEIGQIIDIDLGLDIVEKIVGYLGAGNIRDYIALAFALAAIVALFKAPTTPSS
ncbi:MAG: hypothetical protein JXB47_03990 [Anaerolineae bacterium]|nr:hypothetical protein [Anaerolineae bacterium]